MRSVAFFRLVLIFAGSLTFGLAPLAHAKGCTAATLLGTYGFQEQGQFIGAGFSQFRSVGTLTFDGRGTARRSSTIWYSDFSVVPESDPISYRVSSDCRVSFAYLNNGETFVGVLVDNGMRLFYLETGGDPMRSGEAEFIQANN